MYDFDDFHGRSDDDMRSAVASVFLVGKGAAAQHTGGGDQDGGQQRLFHRQFLLYPESAAQGFKFVLLLKKGTPKAVGNGDPACGNVSNSANTEIPVAYDAIAQRGIGVL